MIKKKISLIPRYNWDYKFSDFGKAFVAVFGSTINSEKSFEKVFDQKPILTTSGRTSLYAILKSLNIPKGSYIGVPLFSCPVVFDAIRQADLIPKFIDIELDDYNLSVSDLKKKKDLLSAIIVIHMFGHPADMDSISTICKGIPVVEDCAQSLFSQYKGRYTGFQSTASFFSFRSGKYISAGEGSAIFCQDPSHYESINKMVGTLAEWKFYQEILHCAATYLKSTLYHRPWYATIGYPIGRRIDKKINLTAKTGFKLNKIYKSDWRIISERIETFVPKINRQRQNAFHLLENVRIHNAFLPYEREKCHSNYYQFAIRFKTSEQRNLVSDYLLQHGIDTAKYLDDVVDIVKEQYGYNGDCLNAERCAKTVLVIPHHYTLSAQDLDYIVHTLNEADRLFRDQ